MAFNTHNHNIKRTYFGAMAMIVALLASLFLTAYFIISQLNITPAVFYKLNNTITLLYCTVSPVAFILGVLGLSRKNDSNFLSWISIGIVGLPFLILSWQMISSLI